MAEHHIGCYARQHEKCLGNHQQELEQYSWDDLCEIVHDMKGEEAASINNAGKEEQIDYILGRV